MLYTTSAMTTAFGVRRRLSLVTMLCFVLTACATTDVTSPYFSRDVGFRYGVFCGAGNPIHAADDNPETRIKRIVSLTPIDDIDRICQFHDLCYELVGHDHYWCDRALHDVSPSRRGEVFVNPIYGRPGKQCNSLQRLMEQAFSVMKKSKDRVEGDGDIIDSLGEAAALPLAPLGVLIYGGIAAEMAVSSNFIGWPDEGQCKLNVKHMGTLEGILHARLMLAIVVDMCARAAAERGEASNAAFYVDRPESCEIKTRDALNALSRQEQIRIAFDHYFEKNGRVPPRDWNFYADHYYRYGYRVMFSIVRGERAVMNNAPRCAGLRAESVADYPACQP